MLGWVLCDFARGLLMPVQLPDEHSLVALFVGSADLEALRTALSLAKHLGAHEAEFVRAASVVFERLGKGTPPGGTSAAGLYATSWVDLFNQSVHDFHQVLRALAA
jgi:hypothetical protein